MTAVPYLATIRHTRTSPLRNDFTYRTCSWVTTLPEGRPPAHATRWLRRFVRFRAADHLGDSPDWRRNVERHAAKHGIETEGVRIVALTGAATMGYAFDPLTLYWLVDGDDEVRGVLAEVRNTYGGRHTYVVRPDDRSVAQTDKHLYVSPFNDVSGSYTMSVPLPDASGFDIRITLHRKGERPFVTVWQGVRPQTVPSRIRLLAHTPLAAQLTSARIYWQGVRLWARRLPIVPRTASPKEPT